MILLKVLNLSHITSKVDGDFECSHATALSRVSSTPYVLEVYSLALLLSVKLHEFQISADTQ